VLPLIRGHFGAWPCACNHEPTLNDTILVRIATILRRLRNTGLLAMLAAAEGWPPEREPTRFGFGWGAGEDSDGRGVLRAHDRARAQALHCRLLPAARLDAGGQGQRLSSRRLCPCRYS